MWSKNSISRRREGRSAPCREGLCAVSVMLWRQGGGGGRHGEQTADRRGRHRGGRREERDHRASVAAVEADPSVRTIIEIGGQDSKIILIEDGVAVDFAMNTVCAAGTGSFLDRQAERLGIAIEQFGDRALSASVPVRIAGRCAVFAESDMIHKQQMGYNEEDIIGGLCEALVRNYLNNVAKGKRIAEKVFFQGGVAANAGMRAAFEKELGQEVTVPEHHDMMGAIGAAILARDAVKKTGRTRFKGFCTAQTRFVSESFECGGCPNRCEVVRIRGGGADVGCFGDRCGKWSEKAAAAAAERRSGG